jgi:hypothetical protein
MEVLIDGEKYVRAAPDAEVSGLLDFRFKCDDLDGEVTIREYLYQLLNTLWEEGDGFSGKRPFGNSGWEFDLFAALIKAGAIDGSLDEEGYVNNCDRKKGEQVVSDLIKELCFAKRED